MESFGNYTIGPSDLFDCSPYTNATTADGGISWGVDYGSTTSSTVQLTYNGTSAISVSPYSTITSYYNSDISIPTDDGVVNYKDKSFCFIDKNTGIERRYIFDGSEMKEDLEHYKSQELIYKQRVFKEKIRTVNFGLNQKTNTERRTLLVTSEGLAEFKARMTLRDCITEEEWRRYVLNGFLVVRGTSGLIYQVFNEHSKRVKVWEGGKHVLSLCIHSDGQCPPTDHVINMKTLVEFDEKSLYGLSNHIITQYSESVRSEFLRTLMKIRVGDIALAA